MARPKKRLVGKKESSRTTKKKNNNSKVQLYIELVEKVRNEKNKVKREEAFQKIVEMMHTRIMQISYKMRIPGCVIDDLYQEALYALRYKAIKDYDPDRSKRNKISAFDSFAILCIRRHLSTKLKAAYQGKQKVLNSSISLNQDRKSSGEDDSVTLATILPFTEDSAYSKISESENYKSLVLKLWEKLSYLEKQVLTLYKQNLSYEEITNAINKRRKSQKNKIKVKSVDNALSRIKMKAKELYKQNEGE